MLKTILIAITAFCSVTITFAQSRLPHDNLSNSFSPSPNASFGGGNGVSVDPFTGRLQAGFPLFSYESKSSGLSHSITLNYQGGGILLDQIAGNCGIGWSIGAGGSLTRMIQGLPDEFGEFGFDEAPATLTSFDAELFNSIIDSKYDGEYDIYNYSIGNSGGQFIIGKNGTVVTLPMSKVKIEKSVSAPNYSSAPLDSCVTITFKLTLENGVHYFYSNFDCSKLEYNNDSPIKTYASSTWYLSKIVSAFDKDTIYFDYSPVVQEYNSGFSEVKYAIAGPPSQQQFDNIAKYKTRVRDMRLTSVRYPDGTTATFNYETFKRLDFRTDNALKDITITNAFTSSAYSYKFNYSYINRGVSGQPSRLPYQSYSGNSLLNELEENFSLQLDSFKKTSGTDVLPGYYFEYITPNLPPRGQLNAFALHGVDHWGYSNGTLGRIRPATYQTESYSGVSGDPDLEYAIRNSLIKVNLPTGGSINVEYELNAIPDGVVTPGDSVFVEGSLISQTSFDVPYTSDTSDSSFPSITPPSNFPTYRVLHKVVVTPEDWPAGYSVADIFSFKTWPRLSSNNASLLHGTMPWLGATIFHAQDYVNPVSVTRTFSATKPQIFTCRVGSSQSQTLPDPPVHVDWKFYSMTYSGINSTPVYTSKYVGGLRVKTLTTSDGIGQNNDMVEEFKYVAADGQSSGFVVNDPKYDFAYSETYDPSPTDPDRPVHNNPSLVYPSYNLVSHYANSQAQTNTQYDFLVRTSVAQNSIKYLHGSPAAYKRVEQYQGTADKYKKKTVYYFTDNDLVSVPTALKNNNFPFITRPDVDFGAGLSYRVESYNAAGILEKKVVNDYLVYSQDVDQPDFTSIKVGIKSHPATTSNHYTWDHYHPVTAKIFPVKTTETEYFINGDSLVNISETIFDTAYMVPKMAKSLNARNEQIVTKYFYPYEFNISGAVTTLQNKGMIYAPIRTEIWKDSTKLLNAAVSTFVDTLSMVKQVSAYGLTVTAPVSVTAWGAFNNTVLLPNASSFTKVANMDKYDTKGNLVQATAKGITTSTVWDYKSSLPIAQVAGATAARIAHTSFEADGKGGWTFNTANVSSFGNSFTGKKVFNLSAANTVTKNLSSTVTYVLSLRTRGGSPTVSILDASGNPVTLSPVTLDIHNSWRQYQVEISSATQVTISAASAIYLDELRLYPKGASMSTCTYDPLFGITSASDANGRTVYYEYDKFGRLKYERDMDRNIIKVNDYKYQESQN